MKKKRGSKLQTRNVISKGDIKHNSNKNTCYAYFKVKKSESLGPKLRDVNNSCTSIIEEHVDGEIANERPKRLRHDFLKQNDVKNKATTDLCIEDVQMIVAAQESYDGGVNCYVCGKLYKSRVCFIKHIWEHTVYWNMFEGAKNHERVLSIQAAIILYCGMVGHTGKSVSADLCNLLVTSPHSSEAKNERDNAMPQSNVQQNNKLHFTSGQARVTKSPDVNEDNFKHESNDSTLRHKILSDNCLFEMPSSNSECKYEPWSEISFLKSPVSPSLNLQSCPASSEERLPVCFCL